jgi:thymidylate kinase
MHTDKLNEALPEYIPGLIAVVGCDGTGKSTLTADLVKHLKKQWVTERRYLGLVSGEDGDKIKRLPLVGVWLERRLATKSSKTQSMSTKSPALWAALIMFGFSLRRRANLRKAICLAQSGVLVISDRYPQADVSGFHYDGPGIGVERVEEGG